MKQSAVDCWKSDHNRYKLFTRKDLLPQKNGMSCLNISEMHTILAVFKRFVK